MKKIVCTLLIIILSVANIGFSESTKHYYVSQDGNDKNPGTIEKPFRSIKVGVSNLMPGDQLNIMGGIYYEMLEIKNSGTKNSPIVIKNYMDEDVIIDGSKNSISDDCSLISIKDVSNIEISGLVLRNLSSKNEVVPSAIFISGTSKNITIANNNIYGISNLGKAEERNAHGIAIYGDDEETISNIKIENNKIHDNILGSSEALVVNGNVKEFYLIQNEVFNNDNIGIDIIAHEKVCPISKLDIPRLGQVKENIVYNNRTDNNPSYYGDKSCAGIYIDGAIDNLIENNRVYYNNFGIEIGVENQGHDVYGNTVSGNSIYYNDIAGFLIGGYEKKLGYARDNKIVGNLIYNNQLISKDGGEIILHKSKENIFRDNKISKKDEDKTNHIEYWIEEKYAKDNVFINNQWK